MQRRAAAARRGINAETPHGTFAGGTTGCKCWECLSWAPIRHGANAYDRGWCRCEVCTAEKVAAVERWRLKAWRPPRVRHRPPEAFTEWNRAFAARNSESLATAANWGKQWTSTELAVVARPEYTAAQAARLLGRSISAVNKARTRLREDPAALDRGFVSGGA